MTKMEDLIKAYNTGNLILFVGAGLSVSLGLPTWSRLISQIAEQLGYEPEVFKTYGDSLALADYYLVKMGSIGPLRSWMDTEWHKPEIDINSSEAHKLIALGNFPIIYTTNFDRWLERAHNNYDVPFAKIAKVSDLVGLKAGGRQIIKFHGDFDDDSSLVLGESSYFRRLELETPLDIKFRSDILGKSVLFIGYSLSDINIRMLFYRLCRQWNEGTYSRFKPKSYFFSHKHNLIQTEILKQWGIDTMTVDHDDPKAALICFLKMLQEGL